MILLIEIVVTHLQAVGQDDVGVHGGDVEVVDERLFFAERAVPQHLQLLDNFTSYLFFFFLPQQRCEQQRQNETYAHSKKYKKRRFSFEKKEKKGGLAFNKG